MKQRYILTLLTAFLLTPALTPAQQASPKPSDDAAQHDKRMEWFREAKFGMFIHFGATTPARLQNSNLTRTEKYEAAVREFNPVEFDAKEWVRIARQGGAKYIVFTTKHHDGFCKWNSALTDRDITDLTVFKRDIVDELAEACKAAGIRLGFYYSIADWQHPQYHPDYSNRNGFHFYPNPDADITKYIDYMHGQLRELCEKYEPCLIWFDGSSGFRKPERRTLIRPQALVDMLHSYGTVSNSRICDDDALQYADYLSMGDNMVPAGNIGVDFEAAGTMNDSWHFSARDEEWKPAEELLARLVDCVGKGGNYLLNVGPTSKGVIPQASASRLKTMGDWLEKNGDAIYGAKAGPHPHALGWGSITQRKTGDNTTLYLNVVDWPKNGRFTLYGLNNKILSASLLATGEPLAHESTFNAAAGLNVLTITVPKAAPDPYVSVIALNVGGTASMEQMPLQQGSGVATFDGYQASIHDTETIPNRPRRLLDFRSFTVPPRGEGIMPGRMMTVAGFNKSGQALSWDFKLSEPGTYEVAVVNLVGKGQAARKANGRMRATVAGQSVESELRESRRMANLRFPKLKESLCVLGTVTIKAPGAHTLTLEVSSDFTGPSLRLSGVTLLRVSSPGTQAETGHKENISTTVSRRPAFSWDHVPLYMHMRKATSFAQEELDYLAGFPLITLEKTTGSKTYGSSEEGSREAAKAIHAVNPEACVLYYRNVMVNYSSYKVNEGLKDIPGAFLQERDGNTQLHRGVREVYDLSNPALRKWWVDHCVEMAAHDEVDGIFLDGNIKALEPAFLGEEIGLEKKQEVAEGYAVMMQDLKNRIPSDKLLLANIIRARLTESGLDYMQYFDGSYLEGIESQANGLTRLEYLAKGIDAIQQAARKGKIICMSMGLGKASLTGLKIDDSRKKLARGAQIQSRLEYCLALFLICAEKYSYFLPHDRYDVNNNRSSVWLKRFPEYDRPLGPPKGPAAQDGYTYTREFESASVFLDIENKEAKITWE